MLVSSLVFSFVWLCVVFDMCDCDCFIDGVVVCLFCSLGFRCLICAIVLGMCVCMFVVLRFCDLLLFF